MVCKLADVHKVVCHAAHQLASLIFIKKRERECLELCEHIAPHVGLHEYAHDMALILNKAVEPLADIV